MSRPTNPLNGSPLDRLLRADLAQLLDRVAVAPGVALAALDPEALSALGRTLDPRVRKAPLAGDATEI